MTSHIGSGPSMWQIRDDRGVVAPGWYLLPLRLFLGVTFLFAGLQKLANPAFFRSSDPASIHAQLVGATHTSPMGSLLAHLVGAAPAIGLVIALGEVAVGIGAVLGMLTRVAAVGGLLLAFSLFLTVSYHSSPYYFGSDIVFFFAWTPLVLAGSAGAPALDTWLARSSAPMAAGSKAEAGPAGAVSRRRVLSTGAVAGIVAAGTAVFVAAVAGIGRAIAPSSTTESVSTLPPTPSAPTTTGSGDPSTTTATPSGTSIGAASGVPVGGSAAFTDPASGDPSLVLQPTAGEFVAFDAICPHEGCTVAYQAASRIIACPCHGSEFNAHSGAVIRGPATRGLTSIKVIKGANGNLYAV